MGWWQALWAFTSFLKAVLLSFLCVTKNPYFLRDAKIHIFMQNILIFFNAC